MPFRRRAIVSAALLASSACHGNSERQPPPDASTRSDPPAEADASATVPTQDPPAWSDDSLDFGFFTAGLDLVHLRGGDRGVVLANGSDFGPQPITLRVMHGNSPPGKVPDWVSGDAAYHTGVCVGDLDHDGNDDVVVTELSGPYGEPGQGGVKVYYGTGRLPSAAAFESSPRWLLQGVSAAGCAVADLDGNEFPEVVVATLYDGAKASGDIPLHPIHRLDRKSSGKSLTMPSFDGSVRVLYDPRRGAPRMVRRSPAPGSKLGDPPTDTVSFASAVRVADLNGDHAPDVVVAGSRVAVYYGSRDDARVSLTRPDWVSEETFRYAPSLDVVKLPAIAGSGERTVVVVSRTCVCDGCCSQPSGYFAYQPTGGPTDSAGEGRPIWQRTYPLADRIVGPSVVLDLDEDGIPDVLTSVFLSRGAATFGGSLQIFRGRLAGVPFDDGPGVTFNVEYEQYATVVGGFHVADFDGDQCSDLFVASLSPLTKSAVFLNPCPARR